MPTAVGKQGTHKRKTTSMSKSYAKDYAADRFYEIVPHLHEVVPYWLDEIYEGDDRPMEVVAALCALRWPKRGFRIATNGTGCCGLWTLDDVTDIETGKTASELWQRECNSCT